jgi:hypothetical protein
MEQRACGVQYRSHNPVVEVTRVGGRVVPDEFPPVGGRTADDRVHLDGECGIGNLPELRRQLVVERRDDELEPGTPA